MKLVKNSFADKRIIKKILTSILIVALVMPYCLSGSHYIYGDDNSDLKEAQDKKNDLDSKYKETEKLLKELESEKSNILSYIKEIDMQMAEIDASINSMDEKIIELEDEIKKNEEGLIKAEEDKLYQYEAMKLRIQFMYEHSDMTYIEALLSATSMSDLLNKAEYINQISQYDRVMLENLKSTIEYISQTKEKLENDKEELVEKKSSLTDQKASLSLLETTKQQELNNINTATSQQNVYMAQIQADKKAIENEIAAIEAKMQSSENTNSTVTKYDGGQFKWPTESTRITSPYGDTDGRSEPHKGIDIGAVNRGVGGDPIYAAYDGKVVISTFSSSAGNYIMIYHGNGLYTRYLHCSSLLVSVGATVKKGQKIALMGTTGNSIGVHLHFDVRLNGVYVSPWNYLSAGG